MSVSLHTPHKVVLTSIRVGLHVERVGGQWSLVETANALWVTLSPYQGSAHSTAILQSLVHISDPGVYKRSVDLVACLLVRVRHSGSLQQQMSNDLRLLTAC